MSIGSGPEGVAVNPSTNTVYVATAVGVSVIDGATNTITATILPVGAVGGIALAGLLTLSLAWQMHRSRRRVGRAKN